MKTDKEKQEAFDKFKKQMNLETQELVEEGDFTKKQADFLYYYMNKHYYRR